MGSCLICTEYLDIRLSWNATELKHSKHDVRNWNIK